MVTVGDDIKVSVVSMNTTANKLTLSMKEKAAGGSAAADLSAFEAVLDGEWLDGKKSRALSIYSCHQPVPQGCGRAARRRSFVKK